MHKNQLALIIIPWTIFYFLLLRVVFLLINSANNPIIYFSTIFSYSFVGFLFPVISAKKNYGDGKSAIIYSFLVPFVFGILLVAFFIIAMANIESFYASGIVVRLEKSIRLMPYAVGNGLLLGIPMGILGYLFGNMSFAFLKKFDAISKK